MTAPKVLVIGLDACDPALARQMIDKGQLPHLGRLLASGGHAAIVNPVGLYVGALWPSLQTGVSPARHGYYWWRQLVPGSYEIRDVASGDFEWPPFWVALSAAGRRVAVVDMPHSSLRHSFDGIQVVGWGAHDAGLPFQTSPPEVRATIESRFGLHPFGPDCDAYLSSVAEIEHFCDLLDASIAQRTAMAKHFLDRDDWDVFVSVFSESHCVGHQCWHVHDPSHRRHDPEVTRQLDADPVERIYMSLDAAVGELLTHADSQTTVLVLLTHGMATRQTGEQLLGEVLDRLDRAAVSPRRRPVRIAMEAVWDRLPRSARTAIMRFRLRTGIDTATLGLGPTAGDLGTRRSFQVPSSGGHGAVRVNLVGREPRGRIDPTVYDAYCAELTAQLLELVNADTGRPAVLRVIKISEHYRGERLHDLPDLLVQWNQDAPIDAVTSPRVGVVRGRDPHVRSGDHRPSGLLLFRGPHVQQSADAGSVPIESLAPTIAALCGVGLPNVDGQPISEVAGVAPVSASADR